MSEEVFLGRYRAGEVIGVGGMGTVVRAHDNVLNRPVALKFLKGEYTSDPGTIERFRREAQIAASLSHTGIAQVFDFLQENGRSFIVMELLEGEDLHALLARQGPLDPKEAASLIARAADALHYAHEAGAVHRDIKPANIFLTSRGEIKVTDFGIALAAHQSPVTAPGALLGTTFYLAPEQINGERATSLSDIYALGCVLFQLLCGRPPFEGENSMAIAQAHLNAPVPSPRAVNPEVPAGIDAVVRRALAKSPADRFSTAKEMGNALRAAAGGVDVDADTRPGIVIPALDATAVIDLPAAPRTEMLEKSDATPRKSARRRRWKRPMTAFALLLGALIALALLATLCRNVGGSTLPDFTEKAIEEARLEARGLGIKVIEETQPSDAAVGTVIGQEPRPGTPLSENITLKLFVSDGQGVRVPNVKGLSLDKAEDQLRSAGFQANVVKRVTGQGDNVVVSQEPDAGRFASRGSKVALTISVEESNGDKRRGKSGD